MINRLRHYQSGEVDMEQFDDSPIDMKVAAFVDSALTAFTRAEAKDYAIRRRSQAGEIVYEDMPKAKTYQSRRRRVGRTSRRAGRTTAIGSNDMRDYARRGGATW
jgi:hypothetical protein